MAVLKTPFWQILLKPTFFYGLHQLIFFLLTSIRWLCCISLL